MGSSGAAGEESQAKVWCMSSQGPNRKGSGPLDSLGEGLGEDEGDALLQDFIEYLGFLLQGAVRGGCLPVKVGQEESVSGPVFFSPLPCVVFVDGGGVVVMSRGEECGRDHPNAEVVNS